MTEPSYEELKARLADLEKQVETKKRSGTIDFRVSEKGGVQRLWTGPLSGDALLRTVDQTAKRCPRPQSVYRRK